MPVRDHYVIITCDHASVTTTEAVVRCPRCDADEGLVQVRTDPPWCSACEWNLDQWPEPAKGSKRHKRALLRNRRRAFAVNRALLRDLAGTRPERPSRTRAGLLLTGVSVALLLFDLALLVLGVLLVIDGRLPTKVLGAVLLLLGIECRLRFFTLPTAGSVDRADAPTLWSIIDDACAAVGAPRVAVLLIDNEFNAFCARSGFRRKIVVSLGLPMWGALSPAGRQALLGHELGHLVNGDPTTSFTTQPALMTFQRLANVFDPEGLVVRSNPRVVARNDPLLGPVGELIGTIFAYTVFFPVQFLCRRAQRGLSRVAAGDHQRAEAYADALAVRLGGTTGATELVNLLLFSDSALLALRRAQPTGDPAQWRAAVTAAVAKREPELQVTEQRAMRYQAHLFASHPPHGLRSRLVRSWPPTEPALSVPDDRMAQADRELARWYKSAQRALANGYVH